MDWLDRIDPRPTVFWHGTNPRGWIEPPRMLHDHELVLVTDGTCQITVGRRVFDVGTGDFLVIPPSTAHVTQITGHPGAYRWCLHFDWLPRTAKLPVRHWVFLPATLTRSCVQSAPPFVPKDVLHGTTGNKPQIPHLLERFRMRWKEGDERDRRLCRATLLELLLVLFLPDNSSVCAREADRAAELARRVRELLDGPVDQDTALGELLERTGCTYAHCCRVFRRTYGVTPGHYLNSLRIERSKILLRDPTLSIKDVARAAGFNGAAYFTRLFRRIVGSAPTVYRSR